MVSMMLFLSECQHNIQVARLIYHKTDFQEPSDVSITITTCIERYHITNMITSTQTTVTRVPSLPRRRKFRISARIPEYITEGFRTFSSLDRKMVSSFHVLSSSSPRITAQMNKVFKQPKIQSMTLAVGESPSMKKFTQVMKCQSEKLYV
jgi:hypothetical protein